MIIAVTLGLAAWSEAHEISAAEAVELKERLAGVERRLFIIEQRLNVRCTDERAQALDYATQDTFIQATSVPELWDGTPFIVDISSSFPNAHDLLDVVASEAEKVREFLGYEVFVAGDVLPLKDATALLVTVGNTGETTLSTGEFAQLLPPDQHIDIRCCDTRPGKSGWASPALRLVILKNDADKSNHIILHELYHLLGFRHPGNSPGVEMSAFLMWGGFYFNGVFQRGIMPTRSSYGEGDLANLACIYD